MSSKLRWKMITIVLVFIVFSAVGVYPILAARLGINSPAWLLNKQLKLGLDLEGGVHFVIRVETDSALRAESEQAIERLRGDLMKHGISRVEIVLQDATRFRVSVPSTGEVIFHEAATALQATFDRGSGGNGAYVFAMKPGVQAQFREDAVLQTRQTIERRVNELGVNEPSIARQGRNGDEIVVQLPGVTNVDRAKEIIQTGGVLEFRLVERGPAASLERLVTDRQPPPGTEILPGMPTVPGDSSGTSYYLVKKLPAITGRDLRNARPSVDENNQPAVSFTLKAEGGRKFGAMTAENIGRQLAIVLDGRVRSAPRIDNRITTDGSIHGTFTPQEAGDLALLLRAGALPVPLTYLEERTIGPSLGADSIRRGVTASVVGLLLVIGFMLGYYKLSGINAAIALIFNLVVLLGLMAYIGAVMTLPGIAGFVLTMGIGVDSNVLIFERIKEELEAGRSVPAAINAGFGRVFLTLLDTHIAGLISAAFLFQFGSGPIRGFAVTLSIGLLSNLFTSTFVSRTLFELALLGKKRTGLSI